MKTCEPTLWMSETCVTCTSVSQLAGYREVRMDGARVVSTLTESMSFDIPVVGSLRICHLIFLL